MAIDQANANGGINGRPLTLIAEDDRYDVAASMRAYEKLVQQDKVSAMIVSTYGAVFTSAEKAKRDKVVMIDALDCNSDLAALPEYTFCLATETESIAAGIVGDITAKGFTKVTLIYEEEAWFEFVRKALESEVKKIAKIEFEAHNVQPSVTDFRSLLARAKNKKTEALIILGNDQMGSAMAQARTLGLDAQFYSIGSMTSPGYLALAGAAAEGTLVSYWGNSDAKAAEKFLSDFKQKFGRAPYLDLATLPSYDAAQVLIAALRKSASPTGEFSRESLKNNLLATKDFPGIIGPISFDKDGAVRTIKEKIYLFKDGKLQSH